jgi:uncharacterized protein
MQIKDFIRNNWNYWYLKVKVIPGSPKNEIFDIMDDNTVKIRISAPREKQKANKELLSFLSKEIWVKKDNIEILAWFKSQVKILRIKNI